MSSRTTWRTDDLSSPSFEHTSKFGKRISDLVLSSVFIVHNAVTVVTVGSQICGILCHVNALRVETFQEEPEGLE